LSKKNYTPFIIAAAVFISLSFYSFIAAAENTEKEKKYIIGEGDVLSINVWKEPDLTLDAIRVRLDGKITFPLLDDIQASGFTTMELKAVIEEKLNEFVESPTVTVTLLDSASKKFYILGEIQNTGEYPILKNLTVMQGFALAGGFTEWASKKEILLFRYEKGAQKKIVINYKDIVSGNFSKNIPIKPDDIIVVP
jgi:polysaccharide export outer membrane protein